MRKKKSTPAPKKRRPFIAVPAHPTHCEHGKSQWGNSSVDGIPYDFPKNVISVCCILCEEFRGLPLVIQDGEVEVTLRLCESCQDEVREMDELPPELTELFLKRLVARREIDAFELDDKPVGVSAEYIPE